MSTELRIPLISMSMEEGVLTEWLVADGTAVEIGTPVYAIETDKTVQEVDSPAAGTLKVIGTPGETYKVGDLIGTIEPNN